MDAVLALLQERSARDLTMEAVAKRAGVGKPTLYKWWPTKAALVMAMFHERLGGKFVADPAATAEQAIRAKVQMLVREFNGLFGKVMADLIAEAQSEPAILQEMHDRHISQRRASTALDIERGIREGEFATGTNAELLTDAIFGPIYYRLLLHFPLTEQYGDSLVDVVLSSVKTGRNRRGA